MNLEDKAKQLRKTVLEMCIKAGTGHVTSCFSCMEIMVALFYSVMKPDDVFILSKGHASPLLYAILADKGLIEEEELWQFAQKDALLGVHLDHHVNGAVITAGSLGHGLGIACGMALADKNRNVYCLLGDGECYEGSVWEAAMFAGEERLNNLMAIVDFNGLMVTRESTFNISAWSSLGWACLEVNGQGWEDYIGNNFYPSLFLVHTIKGKGIPFMENKWEWHGLAPQGEDAERARRELYGMEQ